MATGVMFGVFVVSMVLMARPPSIAVLIMFIIVMMIMSIILDPPALHPGIDRIATHDDRVRFNQYRHRTPPA